MDNKGKFSVGQIFQDKLHIDEQLLERFADLSGDRNPIHLDGHEALSYGYSKRVAHGVLSLALLSRLVGVKIPGPGAIWLENQIQWIAPVFVGDDIVMTATVKGVSSSVEIGRASCRERV